MYTFTISVPTHMTLLNICDKHGHWLLTSRRYKSLNKLGPIPIYWVSRKHLVWEVPAWDSAEEGSVWRPSRLREFWVEEALASSVHDGCALAPLRSGQHDRQLCDCLRTSGHRRKGWQPHQRFPLLALVHLLQSSTPCSTAFLSIGIRHGNTHIHAAAISLNNNAPSGCDYEQKEFMKMTSRK